MSQTYYRCWYLVTTPPRVEVHQQLNTCIYKSSTPIWRNHITWVAVAIVCRVSRLSSGVLRKKMFYTCLIFVIGAKQTPNVHLVCTRYVYLVSTFRINPLTNSQGVSRSVRCTRLDIIRSNRYWNPGQSPRSITPVALPWKKSRCDLRFVLSPVISWKRLRRSAFHDMQER